MKRLLYRLCLTNLVFISGVSAVEFQTVEIAGKRVTVCRVNIRKESLQLLCSDGTGQAFKSFDKLVPALQMQNQKLIFAMNGGMFHSDFAPVGLFISEGRQGFALNTAKGDGNFFLQPNGVFAVTTAGAQVVETSQYSTIVERVTLATQSGPLLVCGGKLHAKFNANSESRLLRNGVGVASPDVAVFAISEDPVNFFEFATLFRDVLKCPDALYLDGTISSLYSTELKRSDSRGSLGPIFAVTEKL